MQAPWVAVYIQTGMPLVAEEEKRLRKNITLAQELGATVVTTADDDIVRALIRTARRHNVSQIIVGKSLTNRGGDVLHGGSLVERLIRESGNIDVYVVQGAASATPAKRRLWLRFPRRSSPPVQYGIAFGAVAASALICSAVAGIMDYRSIGMFFLFVITLLGPFIGPGPLFSAAEFAYPL